MKRKKILMILALLCAVAQRAWADEVKTVLDDGVFTGFTATGGSNTGDGGYAKLVDSNTSTKWCTDSSPFYVEFKTFQVSPVPHLSDSKGFAMVSAK